MSTDHPTESAARDNSVTVNRINGVLNRLSGEDSHVIKYDTTPNGACLSRRVDVTPDCTITVFAPPTASSTAIIDAFAKAVDGLQYFGGRGNVEATLWGNCQVDLRLVQ